MLIIDSSVWIEFLRQGAHQQSRIARMLTERSDEVATTEPVLMEVLAGATEFEAVRDRLNALPLRAVQPQRDYQTAAVLFRSSRQAGEAVRSLNDCLIAAVALRLGDTVVHRDAGFEVLGRMSGLAHIDLR